MLYVYYKLIRIGKQIWQTLNHTDHLISTIQIYSDLKYADFHAIYIYTSLVFLNVCLFVSNKRKHG